MGKSILLVDDDVDLVRNLEAVLTKNNFEVAKASSAREGLQTALGKRPDLIILDVSMETDTAGFEFLNLLRSKRDGSRYREIRNIPVVLLTAINQVTNSRFSLDDKHSFLPEVSGLLTKPVKIDSLLARVNEILQ